MIPQNFEYATPTSLKEALAMLSNGDAKILAGGMSLKVRVALEASAAGIPEVVVAGKARLLGGFPGTRILASARREVRA